MTLVERLSLNHIRALVASASALFLTIAISVGFAAFSFLTHKHEPVGVSILATPAKEVKREETIAVPPPPQIRTYRPEVKKKLDLPQPIIEDLSEHVISTARVPDADRPHTITTTLNTQTGEAQSFVREDPRPWLAIDPRGEIAISAGYKYRPDTGVRPIGRFKVRQDFLQVKALHFGVIGTVDTDRDAYVGVQLSYRW